MFQAITTNWNFFRLIRLIIGVAALVQAIILREWLLAIAGLFIMGMALANKGCGLGGCATDSQPSHTNQAKTTSIKSGITYEEIV